MWKLDRQKYVQILRAEGVNAALTALHRDSTGFEYDTFEGNEGWQPEMWTQLEEVRQLSRDLWDLALQKPELA